MSYSHSYPHGRLYPISVQGHASHGYSSYPASSGSRRAHNSHYSYSHSPRYHTIQYAPPATTHSSTSSHRRSTHGHGHGHSHQKRMISTRDTDRRQTTNHTASRRTPHTPSRHHQTQKPPLGERLRRLFGFRPTTRHEDSLANSHKQRKAYRV